MTSMKTKAGIVGHQLIGNIAVLHLCGTKPNDTAVERRWKAGCSYIHDQNEAQPTNKTQKVCGSAFVLQNWSCSRGLAISFPSISGKSIPLTSFASSIYFEKSNMIKQDTKNPIIVLMEL